MGRVSSQIRTQLDKLCEWLHYHIINRFQQFFDQDDENVPRQWQSFSNDTIRDIYLKSREKALGSLFSCMNTYIMYSYF